MSVKVVLGGHASGVFLVTRVSHEFGGLSSLCPVYYIVHIDNHRSPIAGVVPRLPLLSGDIRTPATVCNAQYYLIILCT